MKSLVLHKHHPPKLWRRLRLEGLLREPGQNTEGRRDCQGLCPQNSHFHATGCGSRKRSQDSCHLTAKQQLRIK